MTKTGFIVAVAIAVFRDGRVLAMRRSRDKDAGAGLWETPSGRVDPGEQPIDAARRELIEETAIEATLIERPIDAYIAMRLTTPMLVLVYRADHVAGEVVRSPEHDDHAWLTPDEFAARTTLERLAIAIANAARAGSG